jgi:hypothetical protein
LKALFHFLHLMVVPACFSQSLPVAEVPAAVRTGAYNNFTPHALSFTVNQGVLGLTKRFAASLYGEKQFLLRELSFYHVGVVQPAGTGAFGLQMAYAGDADYNALKTGLAYGRMLGNHIGAGIQFNYWNQHIRGYGNAAQVTVEGGLLFHFSDAFQAGLQVCNPMGMQLQKGNESVPAIYTIGANYQPSQNITLTTELIKTDQLPVAVQAGAAYKFAPTFWAAAGVSSGTAAFYIDAGYQLHDFNIQVIGSVHPQLGFSPALLLTYNAMGK